MLFPKQSHIERVAAKETTRYAINRPWIKGGNLYATNGRIAVRIPVETDAEDTDGPIPIVAIKEARKKTNDGRMIANGSVSVGGLTVSRDDDGLTMPDVDSVIPESFQSNRRVRFSAKMLFDLAKALGSEAIELELPEDPDDAVPMIVRGVAAGDKRNEPIDGAVGVIMPIVVT